MKIPEIDAHILKQAEMTGQAGLQNAFAGPAKLDPQLVEMWKAVDGELVAMRQRIYKLEHDLAPFKDTLDRIFDERLAMAMTPKNQLMQAKALEASPMEQFKYKYNV